MPDTLSGAIDRVTFHNLDNGYCVIKVRATGHRDLVTVVGHMPQAIAGEYFSASGEWMIDRTHGQQFKAAELKTTPPHTAEGIAKYLGSGLVKGIGPVYAKKIVAIFGEKTLEVIDQSPSFLSQVKGIGPKRLQLIREGWKETGAVRGIMTFLMSHNLGTASAVRIYKAYGENAVKLVQENPYRLSEDVWGFGFQRADALAISLGIARDSPKRIQAAVRHVLQEASTSKGHVGLPEEVVLESTAALTQCTSDQVADAVEQLRITDEIVRDSVEKVIASFSREPQSAEASAGDGSYSNGDATTHARLRKPSDSRLNGDTPFTDLLYLKPLFLAEHGVARQINALRRGEHPLPDFDVEKALAWVETRMTITLAESQREAIRAATTQKLLVVTGGPGTGKTTIVKSILEIFSGKQMRVLLAAPTGRAAKRLSESTGREAKTIHRLLEYDPGVGGFKRGRENPLDVDLLVIDEVSMVDMILMNRLLSAIPPFACVVFVGDVDQLPSVGAGSVLTDLIESGVVAVARLTEIHRQAGSSFIVQAAHAVHHGEMPESAPHADGDFYYIEADDPPKVLERILTMVRDRIPAKFGFDPLRDVQILSPMNKSELGVQNLNRLMQETLNPQGKQVERFGGVFRVGDKVIQTRNNYQREVFNGDIGRITHIEEIDQVVMVDYDGRQVEYEFNDLDELSLAYAVTIHKSQGSEYPAVIIPVHTQHFVMLQRNLIYTGITRGRKLVVLVGSKKALWLSVTKADTSMRFSLLKWRLRAE